MKALRLDISQVLGRFVAEDELSFIQPQISLAHQQFIQQSGPGKEFLGWADWPEAYDKEELEEVKAAARKIQSDSDVLVVVGIGGSYLGARAAIHFLKHSFYNELSNNKRTTPQIVYAGHNLSGTYLRDLLDWLEDKDYSLNVISKSGTTIETALAFRVLKEDLLKKYGEEEAGRRIYATTDAETGALRQEAEEKGYQTFVIPGNIGGRFTVLTPVGLLPMAVSGINIEEVLEGARQARLQLTSDSLEENEAYLYAAIRNILYRKGYSVELLVYYEPRLSYLAEWWKQLFGESEGKDQMGIYPSSAQFTTDLHSLGQFIQDGSRVLFETVLAIDESSKEVKVPYDEENLDGLNYLAGRALADINDKARQGTLRAHVEGDVPNLQIFMKDTSEHSLGYLFYFFELAVTNSAYLNAVNPFDQPGVEAYKKEMFALLGKPDELK